MVTKIQKWGNSQGLRVSKEVLSLARIGVGDEVNIVVEGKSLVIKPVKKSSKKYTVSELIKKMPKNYKPEEIIDDVIGNEVW